MPKLTPGSKRLFKPDAKLVAEVEQPTNTAAEGYTGVADRAGDPTQPEASPPPLEAPAGRPALRQVTGHCSSMNADAEPHSANSLESSPRFLARMGRKPYDSSSCPRLTIWGLACECDSALKN